MSKILLVGDLHMRPELRYSEYIKDGRTEEVKTVLDTIVKASEDCQKVVLLGDNFDVKNPPAQVVRAFTEFIEKFAGKEIFILAGNHSKSADGTSAIDYLREIKNPNWHIITKEILYHDNLVFCPYYFRQELGVDTHEQATQVLMNSLTNHGEVKRDYLFVHHAVSDVLTVSGTSTNLFPEIVLPKKELEKYYKKIITGHIHQPGEYGKTLVAGSIFTNEVNELEKFVFKLNEETNEIESIPLPIRPIIQFKNPTHRDLTDQYIKNPHSIVKAIFTEKQELGLDRYKEALKKFDAYLLLEQYPSERKKMDMEGATMEFDILSLLQAYSKEKNVDFAKLKAAWEEISL